MSQAWEQFAEGGFASFALLLVSLAMNPVALVGLIMTCVLAVQSNTTRTIAVGVFMTSALVAVIGFLVSGTIVLAVATPALLLGVAALCVHQMRTRAAWRRALAEIG